MGGLVIYDPKYFIGECGVYYESHNDKIYWLKKSETRQYYDFATGNLIKRIFYDFETPDTKQKNVALLQPKPGTFIRLDDPEEMELS